jgi:trimethylamine--corrinoid protein Co-methyltransferase
MMVVVRGTEMALRERPWLHTIISPISPLYLDEDDTAQLLLAGKYGLPTTMPIMPAVGTTGPVTLAGTLALANAEWLGTVTLAQCANPGHTIPYFLDPVVADMRTGATLMGAPEVSLMICALAQLGHEFYGIAPEGIGLDSDSLISGQTLFQKGTNLVHQVMAGGKLVVGAGLLEGCLTASPAQLVLDDELMHHARRYYRGIEVDGEHLAADVVDRVGPRGTFLMDKHTTRHMRAGSLLRPTIISRERREEWISDGSPSLEERAARKAMAILSEHSIEPLPEDVLLELESLVQHADARLAD